MTFVICPSRLFMLLGTLYWKQYGPRGIVWNLKADDSIGGINVISVGYHFSCILARTPIHEQKSLDLQALMLQRNPEECSLPDIIKHDEFERNTNIQVHFKMQVRQGEQDSSPTRQFTDTGFWRQFTDTFEDSSSTLFFYHVIDIWLENIIDYCEKILMSYDLRWYIDVICWEIDILFVWLINWQTFDCYMKLYLCDPIANRTLFLMKFASNSKHPLWIYLNRFVQAYLFIFSSPEPKAHGWTNSIPVTPASVRRPSVHNFKHLLLWNHWAN